jgi:hypothetical protein
MRYEVTYQVASERHVDHLDAPDAATAAAMVQEAHGREEGLFELISVLLLDDLNTQPCGSESDGSFASAR